MFSPNSTRLPGASLAAALVLAAGCATQQGAELPDIDSWERRAAVLGGIERFDFSGRIAVKAGDDGFNGKLRWYQQASGFRATVSGPLGIGTVLLEGRGGRVEVTDRDGVRTELHDVERELTDRYGWTIPVESLRYWALGIPDPRVPATMSFADEGRLSELTQRGWTVTVSQYREAGGGQPMPRRLVAANADTRVTVLIDRWVFHETSGLRQAVSLTPL